MKLTNRILNCHTSVNKKNKLYWLLPFNWIIIWINSIYVSWFLLCVKKTPNKSVGLTNEFLCKMKNKWKTDVCTWEIILFVCTIDTYLFIYFYLYLKHHCWQVKQLASKSFVHYSRASLTFMSFFLISYYCDIDINTHPTSIGTTTYNISNIRTNTESNWTRRTSS